MIKLDGAPIDQTDVGKTVDYLAATYQRLAWQLCGQGIDPAHSPGSRQPARVANPFVQRAVTQGAFA